MPEPAGSSPGQTDVSATLNRLEHKLCQLERELSGVGRTPARTPNAGAGARLGPSGKEPNPPDPVAPALGGGAAPGASAHPQRRVGDPAAQLSRPSAQIQELERFGERLQRFTRELLEDYSRVLASAKSRLGEPPTPGRPTPPAPPMRPPGPDA